MQTLHTSGWTHARVQTRFSCLSTLDVSIACIPLVDAGTGYTWCSAQVESLYGTGTRDAQSDYGKVIMG
jgi:hypothetical protein